MNPGAMKTQIQGIIEWTLQCNVMPSGAIYAAADAGQMVAIATGNLSVQ